MTKTVEGMVRAVEKLRDEEDIKLDLGRSVDKAEWIPSVESDGKTRHYLTQILTSDGSSSTDYRSRVIDGTTKAFTSKDFGIVGAVSLKDYSHVKIRGAAVFDHLSGYKFLSYCQRGNGRKTHDEWWLAVPRWFTGYAVKAHSAQEAILLMSDFCNMRMKVTEEFNKVTRIQKGRRKDF